VIAVIFMHEVHEVKGTREDEFEAAFREGWMPMLAKGDDARLLWYTTHAHGSGVAYNIVTVTAFRDAPAWERLVYRVQKGDLQSWMRDVDELRYDVTGKLQVPLVWSPLQDIDFRSVPTDGALHEPTLYMEDTMWPYDGKLTDYIEVCGSAYSKSLGHKDPFIAIEAASQPAFGSQERGEVTLMQRIHKLDQLGRLLSTDIPPGLRAPGSWMYEALAVRDQWESKLLRTSAWSPLF
jgi:hypothetical protein